MARASFRPHQNPYSGKTGENWLLYHLFTLERACTLGGIQRLGKHDWHLKGSRFLVAEQHGSGYWDPSYEGEKEARWWTLASRSSS